jgi:hypothetical protein
VCSMTVRAWFACFGLLITKRLRRCRGPSSGIWRLDEMSVGIAVRQTYL